MSEQRPAGGPDRAVPVVTAPGGTAANGTAANGATSGEVAVDEVQEHRAGLVDVHAHFLTDRYVAEARAIGMARPSGMPAWPTWSAEEHLEVMDGNGIASAVLSISAPGILWSTDPTALARHANDEATAICAERPDRFRFFAILPVQDEPAALAELDRALALPGCVGIVLESNSRGRYLGHPSLAAILDELDRRATVVFVHPVEPGGWERLTLTRPAPMLEFPFDTTRTVADLILTGTLARHPRIRFVFPHLGGTLPFLVDRLEAFRAITGEGQDDPTMREQLRTLWFDLAGTPLPAQLPAAMGIAAEDRIVYGSDYCFTRPPGVARQVRAVDGLPGLRERTSRNAASLLEAAPDR